MKYRNIKTGAIVETKYELIGGNWHPLEGEDADVPAQEAGTENSKPEVTDESPKRSPEVTKVHDKAGKKTKGAVIRPKKE